MIIIQCVLMGTTTSMQREVHLIIFYVEIIDIFHNPNMEVCTLFAQL